MIYTPLIRKALAFAIKVHELDFPKRRKASSIPYITHPLAVGLLLARVSRDENIIAAGLLHDTIEDCEPYGSVTRSILETEFNAQVAQMVDDVTEQDKSLPWEERKAKALEHIRHMQQNSLLVKSADVVHNMTELIADYDQSGEDVFTRFNATRDVWLKHAVQVNSALLERWKANPLAGDLKHIRTWLTSKM